MNKTQETALREKLKAINAIMSDIYELLSPPKPVVIPTTTTATPEVMHTPEEALTLVRAAATAYAKIHGRLALRTILDKFTTKTVSDVPPEQLNSLLKALK